MTEFSFVLVLVIEAFNSVVGSSTLFFFWTFFSLCEFAKFWSVMIIISSLIFDRMVKIAALVVMGCILFVTFDPLEISQIQVFYVNGLAGPMM